MVDKNRKMVLLERVEKRTLGIKRRRSFVLVKCCDVALSGLRQTGCSKNTDSKAVSSLTRGVCFPLDVVAVYTVKGKGIKLPAPDLSRGFILDNISVGLSANTCACWNCRQVATQ